MIKEIVKKVPTYKKVKSGVKEIKAYETSDGKTFFTKRDAKNHEDDLKFENFLTRVNSLLIKEIPDIIEIPFEWYYAENEDQLKIIKEFFGVGTAGVYTENVEFKIGEWYARFTSYEEDHYSTVFSLSNIRKQIQQFLDLFEKEI